MFQPSSIFTFASPKFSIAIGGGHHLHTTCFYISIQQISHETYFIILISLDDIRPQPKGFFLTFSIFLLILSWHKDNQHLTCIFGPNEV